MDNEILTLHEKIDTAAHAMRKLVYELEWILNRSKLSPLGLSLEQTNHNPHEELQEINKMLVMGNFECITNQYKRSDSNG